MNQQCEPSPYDGQAITFAYHYGVWRWEEDAQTWCDAVNKIYGEDGMWFRVEYHQQECEHSALGTGYYVVARNEQGERWTCAPWESGHNVDCEETMRKEDEEYGTIGNDYPSWAV